jgi:fatty-acyl-CoA synthase
MVASSCVEPRLRRLRWGGNRRLDTRLNEVPHDGKTPGEVVVRAPWLTQEYVDDAEASERLWAGGYLHTEDIGITIRMGLMPAS